MADALHEMMEAGAPTFFEKLTGQRGMSHSPLCQNCFQHAAWVLSGKCISMFLREEGMFCYRGRIEGPGFGGPRSEDRKTAANILFETS